MAKGAPRNHVTESCLCLKSLSDTYKPKRTGSKRGGPYSRSNVGGVGSSALWSPVVLPGSYKFPPTEPIQRRKPLTALTYFPSFHNDPPITLSPSEPQSPAPDEVIYDDVHQSTIYLNNGDSVSQHVSFIGIVIALHSYSVLSLFKNDYLALFNSITSPENSPDKLNKLLDMW